MIIIICPPHNTHPTPLPSGFFVSSGDLDVVKRTPIKAKASTMSNNNQEARLPVITSMGAPEMSIQNNNSKKSTNIANIDAIDTRHVSNIGSRLL